jgi:hypothetical protein
MRLSRQPSKKNHRTQTQQALTSRMASLGSLQRWSAMASGWGYEAARLTGHGTAPNLWASPLQLIAVRFTGGDL